MYSRSGWLPAFNALLVGTAVLLLLAAVQPGPLPIQKSFAFLASVSGQPPMLTPANLAPTALTHSESGQSRSWSRANDVISDAIDEVLSIRKPVVDSDSRRANVDRTLDVPLPELSEQVNERMELEPVVSPVVFTSDDDRTSMLPVSCAVRRDGNRYTNQEAVPATQPILNQTTTSLVSSYDDQQDAEDPETEQSESDSATQPRRTPILRQRQERPSEDSESRWPRPEALIEQLDSLRDLDATRPWADNTIKLIDMMCRADSLADPVLKPILGQLENQRLELAKLTETVSTCTTKDYRAAQGQRATELLRLDYSLSRRLAVWRLVHQFACEQHSTLVDRGQPAKMIQASVRTMPWNVHPQWREYLLIDEAESAFKSLNPNELEQQRIARRVLGRVHSPALSLPQQQFALSAFQPELYRLLKSNASSSPDLHSLLEYIEKQEQDGSGLTNYKINTEYQNLLWSDNKVSRQLASELDTHYRNANFRVSVSEQFVNRLIPEMPATAEPVSERILGADVFGQNHIQNQMGIEFIPDPTHIQMQIVTVGEVFSNTRASKSGFTIDNRGTTRFHAFKRLAFGRNGVFSDHPVTASSADQQMVGMTSRLDPIPLVGWVARRIAKQKIAEQRPRAEQIVRQRVESTVSERMQYEVETQLNQLRAYLDQNIYQPLVAMDLEPDAVEMSTSSDRLVMRYRLAGRDQMAAYTARPRAATDNLVSMQIHESAINNMLMRIELGGRTFSSQELIEHLEQRIGTTIGHRDEIEHEATFEFAHFDPIRVDFDNDRVQITINLRRFKVGEKGKTWRNLTASTTYIPQVQGRTIVLAQEEGEMKLQGKGLKLRDQIAIRTIFEALFDNSYTLAPLPASLLERLDSPDLHISQLVVENGWIGVSISEPAAHQASQQAGRGLLRRRR